MVPKIPLVHFSITHNIMKQFMSLGLLIVIFTFVYGCSFDKAPSIQTIQEDPLNKYSSGERLALYT